MTTIAARAGKMALAALAVQAGLAAGAAEAASYRSEYVVSAFGLRLASTSFDTRIGEAGYTISGTMRARGIARLFTTTSGTLAASGAIGPGSVASERFDVRYTDAGKDKRTVITFAGGRVASASNQPEVKRAEDWIAVPAAELAGVLDPIAAMLVPAASPRAVCDRTIRTFSGALRADLQLSYLRTVPFSTAGFDGDAVTCSARFVPIAGYNRSKREINAMRDSGRIEISFAPVASTALYAPVKARIRYQGTTVNVTATRFEQVAD